MKNTRVFIGILSHNTLPTSYLLIIFISTSYEDQGTKPGGNKPIWRRTFTLYTLAGLWLLSFVNTDCIQHKNVINRLRTVCVIRVFLKKNCTEWQLVLFISIFNRARKIIYVKIIIIFFFLIHAYKVHIHEISDEISPRINRYLMLFKMP